MFEYNIGNRLSSRYSRSSSKLCRNTCADHDLWISQALAPINSPRTLILISNNELQRCIGWLYVMLIKNLLDMRHGFYFLAAIDSLTEVINKQRRERDWERDGKLLIHTRIWIAFILNSSAILPATVRCPSWNLTHTGIQKVSKYLLPYGFFLLKSPDTLP